MKIKFMGAAGTVTGSSYILTSGTGQSIVIDLGMFQGTEEIDALNFKRYEYNCSTLYGGILTHAHLDHCGRLPILMSHGFQGKVWMTPATRDLTELSLFDSAKIAKRFHKQSLYDKGLVEAMLNQCVTVEYRTPVHIGAFNVTFRDAGHLLGAASIEIEDTSPDTELKKIVFSGDLGNTPQDLLQATERIDSADVVVMESTYGDSLHPDLDPADILEEEINKIEQDGGTLLIPAFSMERTQELLHLIMHLKHDGRVRGDTPVFMDSPMAEKATAIYMDHTNLLNDHIQSDLKAGTFLDFEGLEIIRRIEDSHSIVDIKGPKVIIAGGGMMTGGRIVSHAAIHLPNPKNRLLLVGYQGEETLGRQLQEGQKVVEIEGLSVSVRATVSSTRSMSSHADQRQLLEWLGAIKGVKKVILTHGEDGPRQALADKITETLGITDISLPVQHEEISF